MKKIYLSFSFLIISLFLNSYAAVHATAKGPIPFAVNQTEDQRKTYEAFTDKMIIATQGTESTKAAIEIYAKGGNLIDAAIAASFVISVERPQSTGLGGGGFMLFHDAKSGKDYAIDFRERAPLAATEKMFLDAKGEIIPDLSTEGILSAGTPGLVAGLWEIHQKFGKLPWADLVRPAILLAEKGVVVYPHLATAMKTQKDVLSTYSSTKKIFLKENGDLYLEAESIVQKDLANTLRLIAKDGAKAFYQGPISKQIVAEFKKHKGLVTAKDLADYKVHWREPVRGTYKGYEVLSFPPPSSGGVHIIEILNILENDNLKQMGPWSKDALHLTVGAMQLAFADRAQYLGDPDFVKVPTKGLTSKSYAADQRKKIPADRALKADEVAAANAPGYESSETTNFSLMDADGNAIISTQTLNGYMGSGVVVEGAGFLLNNEMDDFSAKPGSSNMYGAVGGTPNSIAPLKTPLSSMSPTIVLKNNKPVLGLGAPGGTKIITCVTQTILNYLEYGLPLYDSVADLRFHHQWKPDELLLETPGPSAEVVAQLTALGYTPKVGAISCKVNAVSRESDNKLHGVADPRDLGAASGL
ncbi:MAG: gamma-glutamyltransferase [Deltaproteobacteria bacterium]|nr:gamma-glutamyltransferase [Deltaproteobacteria bacterium]